MRRWRWWATRLCRCRFGCSKYIARQSWASVCGPFFALLKLGLLTLQTVPHCHSTDWGGMKRDTASHHVNTTNLREMSLKRMGTRRNLITGRSWERQMRLDEVRPRQGQHSGQLWQHRSLFLAPPILPRSVCGCALESNPQCSSHNKLRCYRGHVLSWQKDTFFCHIKKIWSNNSSWFKTGTLSNTPLLGTLPTPFAVHLTTDKC